MDHANQLSAFVTSLGWFGIVGRGEDVLALTFGQSDVGAVHARLLAGGVISRCTVPSDWCPALRKRLTAYARGAADDFADVRIVDTPATDFQRAVVRTVRAIGHGRMLSYGEVAARAGSPGAARAVGHVMAINRVPILVPCHRVIASGGKPGGYSGAHGLRTKLQLLSLERAPLTALSQRACVASP
jgi:methylated-DNA-[protein]-cysteine S-methyltransferase